MKATRPQFGARENTASSRQHASRLAVNLSSLKRHPPQTNNGQVVAGPATVLSDTQIHISDEDAAESAATGEKTDDTQLLSVREVSKLLHVPVSWVYEHTRPRCANPLPHLKLGKYLRFFPSDIADYLQDARSLHGVWR